MQYVRQDMPPAGFGLGRLHHVLSGKERERIVLGAMDAGIAHFDLAAAYGDGLCEAEAGRLLSGRRAQVSFATKFGIPCRSMGGRNVPLYFAGKAFRKAFSRSYGSEYSLRDFSAEAAIRGVEQSLKRLRTDYLDYLFFHEPRGGADLPSVLETAEAMECLKRQGKVLQFGVSATTNYFLACGHAAMIGDVVQFELAETSPSLLAQVPSGARTSAFGLMRFLGRENPGNRFDYGTVLQWFSRHYPQTMPIFATNRPSEIAKLGQALAETGFRSRAIVPRLQSGEPSGLPAQSR
jgi:hypothetical protein